MKSVLEQSLLCTNNVNKQPKKKRIKSYAHNFPVRNFLSSGVCIKDFVPGQINKILLEYMAVIFFPLFRSISQKFQILVLLAQ